MGTFYNFKFVGSEDMKIYEIIDELASFKKENDWEGFRSYFEKLSSEDVKKLHKFSIKLKNSCEQQMKK